MNSISCCAESDLPKHQHIEADFKDVVYLLYIYSVHNHKDDGFRLMSCRGDFYGNSGAGSLLVKVTVVLGSQDL